MEKLIRREVYSLKTQVIAIVLIAVTVFGVFARPAAAATPARAIGLKANLNGRDITKIGDNTPLRMQPDQPVIVDVTVSNTTSRSVTVRSVRISGRVMGLTFFSFETELDLLLASQSTQTRIFAVQLLGLKGQATGLLPSRLEVLDQHRHVIASHNFPANVEGSVASVYGVFGLMVAAISGLLLLSAIIRLANHRLSHQRWSRGLYFAAPGFGIGLTLTISLSALRILLPKPSSWIAIVLVSTIVLFLIGFVTPTPSEDYFTVEANGAAPDSGMSTPTYAE